MRERQVQRGGRPARRRRDRAVHRPLPQGGHRRLDDAQLRTLEERLRYLRELEERRAAVLESIRAQGKLDDALEAQILAADSKARLEDIYLPYKPKRRTKAQIAREAGLEPLADAAARRPDARPGATAAAASSTPDKGVADAAAALDGARAILVERFAEDADLIGELRERMWSRGRLVAKVRDGQGGRRARSSPTTSTSPSRSPTLPSHRILALFRGEKEEVLDLDLDPERAAADGRRPPRRPTTRRRIAAPLRRRRPGPPGRPLAARHGPLGLAHPDPGPPRHRPADAAAAGGRGRGGRGSSPPTCATCCSPRRPAPAPRWAWTRASAPA